MHEKNKLDIVILTDNRYVNPKQKDWYIDQVLQEDKILQKALEKKGLKVCKKDWADTKFDWNTTKFAIFRTTWDYFDRFNEFINWINKTKKKTTFINPIETIIWNIDKHYLKDLSENGLNINPTLFIEKNKKTNLKKLFKKTGWKEAVIKPAISGAAKHTYRIQSSKYSDYEEIFQKLIREECMLFQEFMCKICTEGEISIIMIGGEYTHAVRKIAKKGDFRVQDDHGGTVQEYIATKEEILFAKQCIQNIATPVAYARVDIIYDNKNNPSLSELELIEPELWFRNNPQSANMLAEEICKIIS